MSISGANRQSARVSRQEMRAVLVVFHEHRLTEQVRHGHPQRTSHVRDDVQPADIPFAALDLAQPVHLATNQVGEDLLSQTAPPVELSGPLPRRST